MSKTQIVYALVSTPNDLYLQELWVSLYSLRLYEPDREVRVCCDEETSRILKKYEKIVSMLTEIVIVPKLDSYARKFEGRKSRHIKTTLREYMKGPFLYIDTDTVICAPLNEIDELNCDIAGVCDANIDFHVNPFRQSILRFVQDVFGIDASQHPHWINGGVLYVADNAKTHEFFRVWHENWRYAATIKNVVRDMPPLLKAEIDTNLLITELPGYFNAQPYMSMHYFCEAKILHFLHSFFPEDQSFCPFFDKKIYKEIKEKGDITEEIGNIIQHAKSAIASPSMIVGERTLKFLTSPAAPIFEKIYSDGGVTSWLMGKMAVWLGWLHKYTKKK